MPDEELGDISAPPQAAEARPPSDVLMISRAATPPPPLSDGEGDRVVYVESFDL